MKSIVVVIEGTDGSGKATQSKLLKMKFEKEGKRALLLSYPEYTSESSFLTKLYLEGVFGKKANDIDGKNVSVFYGIDRYRSYKKHIENLYKAGDAIIILDRYTTANMVHQVSKINGVANKNEMIDWIAHFEYDFLGLPRPDKVIFLSVKPETTKILMKERRNEFTGSRRKDIHERSIEHLERAFDNAYFVADKYDWNIIKCDNKFRLRTIESIGEEIKDIVDECIDESKNSKNMYEMVTYSKKKHTRIDKNKNIIIKNKDGNYEIINILEEKNKVIKVEVIKAEGKYDFTVDIFDCHEDMCDYMIENSSGEVYQFVNLENIECIAFSKDENGYIKTDSKMFRRGEKSPTFEDMFLESAETDKSFEELLKEYTNEVYKEKARVNR
ncbi:MAG: hypothetical protein N4A47_01595 [Clostridia bacterium]|jgi:dTMP kinase|nr:hypothetical protein [Clostridia bacterium]